jgi:hypothetical protein
LRRAESFLIAISHAAFQFGAGAALWKDLATCRGRAERGDGPELREMPRRRMAAAKGGLRI